MASWFFMVFPQFAQDQLTGFFFVPLPSGKLTYLWKITNFNRKIHYQWPFSSSLFVCLPGRVHPVISQVSVKLSWGKRFRSLRACCCGSWACAPALLRPTPMDPPMRRRGCWCIWIRWERLVPMVSWESTHLMRQAPALIRSPKINVSLNQRFSGWYNSMYLLVSSGSTLKF